MGYSEFIQAFAENRGLASADVLLNEHAEKYSFQIKSRERAQMMIAALREKMDYSIEGKNVLDIGCAYGSFSIEMARLGAEVVGVDISSAWLRLAEINAQDDADVTFINADASSFPALKQLAPHGPFDFVVLNDVLEHIFDTPGLFSNIVQMTKPGATVYFKVPNGLATRHVLQEGHKKVFGISLLPPDYWSHYVGAPFHIYYRRWSYFEALFDRFGLTLVKTLNTMRDANIEQTRRKIRDDLKEIDAAFDNNSFKSDAQKIYLQGALQKYREEVEHDLEALNHEDLFFKYRITFWEGVLCVKGDQAAAAKNAAAQNMMPRRGIADGLTHLRRRVAAKLTRK